MRTGIFLNPRFSVTTDANIKQARLKQCPPNLPGGILVDALPPVRSRRPSDRKLQSGILIDDSFCLNLWCASSLRLIFELLRKNQIQCRSRIFSLVKIRKKSNFYLFNFLVVLNFFPRNFGLVPWYLIFNSQENSSFIVQAFWIYEPFRQWQGWQLTGGSKFWNMFNNVFW